MPGMLAFIVVRASTTAFIEVLIYSLIIFFPRADCSVAHRCFGSPIFRSIALYLCKRMYCLHPISTRVSCLFLANDVRLNEGRMKLFPRTINRNDENYREKHYRARWQPLWAILGLVLCTLLVVTQGWTGIYDLCAASPGVSKEDSVVDIVAAYLGVSYS